ncbi:hypothetical protein EJD96_00195 (plasmid) [Herbaspirillum seropedicae]|uniref:hypothetical protein n=1 Tax=Herbaspirillum seropedicae TaxID=964 RepID=UPI00111F8BFA|nr:hypothetical protein [Herbaspirillum seropedicae]QDD62670.1 hypothetical protein EJD96_00195 [Herbaspirillum seropedicae]
MSQTRTNIDVTPWRFERINPDDKKWTACEILEGDRFVATHVCTEEDAARIVCAANTHADLVAALRLAVETIETHQAFWSRADLESMKAVLAKAGAA